MIKILIADDSATDAAILKKIIEAEPDMEVVGIAHDGLEAVAMVERFKPNMITMDIKMPKMDGYEAIDMIMKLHPTPIVVISSMVTSGDSEFTFKALEAGALTVLAKPVNIQSPSFAQVKRNMLDTIRNMSEIKVIRKRKITSSPPSRFVAERHGDYQLIAIGSSVGGPQALREILTRLPSNFPMPIVCVQHMSAGFLLGFTKWLDAHVALKIKYAEDEEVLMPGTVYFAPDHLQMQLKRVGQHLRISLVKGELVSGFCPSISVLMKSVAHHCGKHAIGALLTGMGSDGAEGMLALKQAGSHTIIQDPESCVVFGMANVAQSLGGVDKVVKLDKMAEYLIRVTNKKK